jgi:hypothetical protein
MMGIVERKRAVGQYEGASWESGATELQEESDSGQPDDQMNH